MKRKRPTKQDYVVASPPRTDEPDLPDLQNAHPLVLEGQAIRQLNLPIQFLSGASKKRPQGTVIGPSNMAEVRVKLAARKSKIG